MKKTYIIEDLCCANCANKIETRIKELDGVTSASLNFIAQKLFVEFENEEIVDITEDIRAELLINLPANLLCSDDCAGLCPVCGADLNSTDCGCVIEDQEFDSADEDEPSPWAALDNLKLDK